MAGGTMGIIHGARTVLLQDADGQVQEAHSISAGLDYPGVGPQLAALALDGRLELARVDRQRGTRGDEDQLARCEGILPALESAHALAALPRLLGDAAPDCIVVVGLSGRGDKDMGHLERHKVTRSTLGSQRIQDAFAGAAAAGRIAFVPYVVAGYPDHESSVRNAVAALDAGADLIEIGLPYSDPARRRRYGPAREHGRAGERRDARQIVRPRGDRRGATSGQAAAGHGLREPVSGATRRRSDCAAACRERSERRHRAGPDARRRRASRGGVRAQRPGARLPGGAHDLRRARRVHHATLGWFRLLRVTRRCHGRAPERADEHQQPRRARQGSRDHCPLQLASVCPARSTSGPLPLPVPTVRSSDRRWSTLSVPMELTRTGSRSCAPSWPRQQTPRPALPRS